MHGRTLITAAITTLVALVALAGLPVMAAGSTAAAAGQPDLERAVLQEMNAVRVAHGRPPLKRVAPLARPARGHSAWLARTGEFQHEGPGGSPFWTRLVAAGFPRTAAMGENIALTSGCGAALARQVVDMWMESPAHRAILLSPRFRVTGVGAVATEGCRTSVVTADYGGVPPSP